MTLENTQRAIRRNVLTFFASTICYNLSGSYLAEGYIQAYLLSIGLDTMAIGIYGTCSTLAALLGFALFSIYRPKRSISYVKNILLFGLLGCALPLALIGAPRVRFALVLLCAGVAMYQISMSMKTSCEFSAIPMLIPREIYGSIAAKCGVIGSALAAALSAAGMWWFPEGSSERQYLVFFLLAFFGLMASALAARAYTPMESLMEDEKGKLPPSEGALAGKLWLLLPHFLRGAASACFYYFVTISFRSVKLSAAGQSAFVTVGVVSTMLACFLFMKLQNRFKTGAITLWSNVIAAAVAVATCLNASELGFFALYVVYTLAINVAAYAIPAGVMYCTPASEMPFISSMRMLVMNGAICLLLTPIAGLLKTVSPWAIMAAGGAIHIAAGAIFAVQYTDVLKTHGSDK